jgi:HAD superfamily hydrolase (TIGR01490 family)
MMAEGNPSRASGAARRAAPGHAYAFFDVDETVITVKSMFSFQDFWYERGPARPGGDRQAERARFHAGMRALAGSGACREEVNRRYYEFYADRSAREVAGLARSWFEERVKGVPAAFREQVVTRLGLHRREGVRPVFVSGSLLEILLPLAREMQVDDLLCTRLEVVDGRFTGRILPPQMIGAGKAAAVREFIRARGAEPAACHAYGDDISDAAMLGCVGSPHAVAGNPRLERYARDRGWDVLR